MAQIRFYSGDVGRTEALPSTTLTILLLNGLATSFLWSWAPHGVKDFDLLDPVTLQKSSWKWWPHTSQYLWCHLPVCLSDFSVHPASEQLHCNPASHAACHEWTPAIFRTLRMSSLGDNADVTIYFNALYSLWVTSISSLCLKSSFLDTNSSSFYSQTKETGMARAAFIWLF